MGDWLCISPLRDFEGARLVARKVTAGSSTNDCKLLAGRSLTEWMDGWIERRMDEWMLVVVAGKRAAPVPPLRFPSHPFKIPVEGIPFWKWEVPSGLLFMQLNFVCTCLCPGKSGVRAELEAVLFLFVLFFVLQMLRNITEHLDPGVMVISVGKKH